MSSAAASIGTSRTTGSGCCLLRVPFTDVSRERRATFTFNPYPLAEPLPPIRGLYCVHPQRIERRASFYDDCKIDPGNPCSALSSGEEFHADRPDNAASPIYPNGTILALVNPKTHASALVRINNSGPYKKGRLLDVSRAAAEQLGFLESGTAQLKVTVMPAPEDPAIVAILATEP